LKTRICLRFYRYDFIREGMESDHVLNGYEGSFTKQ
jgi:hypothetical protein